MLDFLFQPKYKLELYKKVSQGYDENGAECFRYEWRQTVNCDISKGKKTIGLVDFLYTPKEVSRTKGLKQFICKDIDSGASILLMGQANYDVDITEILRKDKANLAKEALHGGVPINTITIIAIAGLCLVVGLLVGLYAPQIAGGFN